MTRDEKAALRAKARELRRHPQQEQGDGEPDEQESADEPRQNEKPQRESRTRAEREPPRGASGDQFEEVAGRARRLLRSLRGVDAESVSGISRTANGWKVTLEVVEMRRIPESTDVLASYEVELDGDGDFLGFERGGRYHRSQAQNGGSR